MEDHEKNLLLLIVIGASIGFALTKKFLTFSDFLILGIVVEVIDTKTKQ